MLNNSENFDADNRDNEYQEIQHNLSTNANKIL